MKIGKVEINLAYTGGAMLEINDITDNLPDAVKDSGTSGGKLFVIAEIMARYGELQRRYLGYDPNKIYTAAQIARETISAGKILSLKTLILMAYIEGAKSENKQATEDVDLLLAEWDRQNGKSSKIKKYEYLSMAKVAGLTAKEAIVAVEVGTLKDMFDLANRRGGGFI